MLIKDVNAFCAPANNPQNKVTEPVLCRMFMYTGFLAYERVSHVQARRYTGIAGVTDSTIGENLKKI